MAVNGWRIHVGRFAASCLTILVVCSLSAVSAGQTEGQGAVRGTERLSLSTAHCLAHCFTQLNINPTSNKECDNKPICKTCIHMCELLQTNPATWRPVCGEKSCNKGCMTACSHVFHDDHQPEVSGTWELPSPPSVTLIDGGRTLFVHWRRPRPTQEDFATPRRRKFVYLVMAHLDDHWTPIDWTLTTHARIPLTVSENTDHFRLVAVTPREVAVNVSVPEVGSPERPMADYGKAEEVSSGEADAWSIPTKVEKTPPGMFHSARVVVRTTTSGQAEAVVTWEQRLQPHLSSATYVVTWSRHSCGASHCPLPPASHTIDIRARRRKTVKVTIRDLTFSSDYSVDIGFPSFPSERLLFVTPPCAHPDATYRRCQEPPTKGNLPTVHVTTPISLLAKLQRVKKANGDNMSPTVSPKAKGPETSGRTGRLTVAAVLASLIGVTTVCVSVGAYVIYRRWANNKQARALRSCGLNPRLLWTPSDTLSRDLSSSTPGSPGSYRRNPLASLLSPDMPRPLEEEDASPGGASENTEGRPEMWTLLAASGDLQHLTRTPEHAHSTPEHHSRARLIRKSSASPIQSDWRPPGRAYRTDLPLHFRPRLNAYVESDSDSDTDSDHTDVRGGSVVARCGLDFSTSLRLSAVDVDCFSDSDSDDQYSFDRSFTASCSTTSDSSSDSSSEEGSFRLYTLDDQPSEEMVPFVTSGNSGVSGQVTLRDEIESVLKILDNSYDSYFV